MGTKNVLARVLLTLLIIVIVSQKTHAADAQNLIRENISQSTQSAWSALSDFMGEVWQDTIRITSSFFKKVVDGMQAAIVNIIKVISALCGWIAPFVPAGLRRVFAAIGGFFSQIFQLIDYFIKNLFSELKPPTDISN